MHQNQPQSFSDGALLCTSDVLRWLGVSRTTLYHLIKEGKFPAGTPLGGSPRLLRWAPSEVQAAVECLRAPSLMVRAGEKVEAVTATIKKRPGRPRKFAETISADAQPCEG